MNFDSRKTMAAAVAIFLMIALIVPLVTLPLVGAQTYDKQKNTFAQIGLMPNPVGVGQEVLVWIGISDMLYVYSDGWEGLTVTVTKPDGTTETLGPYRTDSTGSTGITYTPSMVGTYKFQTHFPAQLYTWTRPAMFDPELFGPVWYRASDSKVIELVVVNEQVPDYPRHPLPSEYWTRPIDAQNREWNTISADWLTVPNNRYAPYNEDAPETAHILWTKQLVTGGLAGGANGPHAYECGDAYEGKFGTGFPSYSYSVIVGGVLFYNQYESRMPTQEVVAVDVHTGKELWRRPLLDPNGVSRRVSFAQSFYWDAWNYHGVFGYIWTVVGNTWHAYNPVSGDWIFSIENVPSGTSVYGPKGEIYRYGINLNTGQISLWNQSRVVQPQTSGSSGDGSWRPQGRTFDGSTGIEWTKTIPRVLPGGISMVLDDRVVGCTADSWSALGNDPIGIWAFSLKKGQEGMLLFNKTWTRPAADLTMNFGSADSESGVFVLRAKETQQWWGFSLDTGAQLWGPTESEADLGIFGMNAQMAYGKLYASNKMSGILYCYDAKTGALLWEYAASDPYNEILWSNNWPIYTLFITDGKVYLGHSEHSPVDPKPRGAPFICLDAETGEEIFRADGLCRQTDWGGQAIIGDSIIATMDTYDQRIYGLGKGPTSTTAMIRSDVLPLGSSVLIQGMITDISPGTEDYALKARFPNGVPVVADESMSAWMAYVYKQFPHPDIVGVPVFVHVLDENGNYRNIGETTTDPNGFYSLTWVPDIPGKYSVIVSFAGSKAYYPSYAYTAFQVDERLPLPPAEPTPEPLTLPPFDLYFVVATAVIVAAIAIVGILILRKK